MGAITCAAVCLVFHPLDFSLHGMIEMLTTFAAIYGVLIIKAQTGMPGAVSSLPFASSGMPFEKEPPVIKPRREELGHYD